MKNNLTKKVIIKHAANFGNCGELFDLTKEAEKQISKILGRPVKSMDEIPHTVFLQAMKNIGRQEDARTNR